MQNSRRGFIKKSFLATAGISTGLNAIAKEGNAEIYGTRDLLKSNSTEKEAFTISIFSKHLHWLNYDELAKVAGDAGFDGVDLTVRPGGHVLPENVERDLPLAVAAIRKAGLDVYIISTGILDADDPLSERVLKTASSLGIGHYRMNVYRYDDKVNIEDNLKIFEKKMTKLARLNKKYKISGEYQNHSLTYDPGVYLGQYYGATIWDLYKVLKKINSPWMSSQYDVGHATIECSLSWAIGLELLTPYIKSLHVKDFVWAKDDTGKWFPKTVHIGEGMVDYKKILIIFKEKNIRVPITSYYGMPIGDEKTGIDMEVLKKSLVSLKSLMANAGLSK